MSRLTERLTALLDLLQDAAAIYEQAPDQVRSLLNQVFFVRILAGSEESCGFELHADVAALLDPQLRAWLISTV